MNDVRSGWISFLFLALFSWQLKRCKKVTNKKWLNRSRLNKFKTSWSGRVSRKLLAISYSLQYVFFKHWSCFVYVMDVYPNKLDVPVVLNSYIVVFKSQLSSNSSNSKARTFSIPAWQLPKRKMKTASPRWKISRKTLRFFGKKCLSRKKAIKKTERLRFGEKDDYWKKLNMFFIPFKASINGTDRVTQQLELNLQKILKMGHWTITFFLGHLSKVKFRLIHMVHGNSPAHAKKRTLSFNES